MRLSGIISREGVESIHRSVLLVLEKVGVRVEHPEVRKRLGVCGGRTKPGSDRVYFPGREVEKHLAEASGSLPEDSSPWVGSHVEVYGTSLYENPKTGELGNFDEGKLACYFGLAENLPTISSTMLEGTPFPVNGVPPFFGPLTERLYAWKLGAQPAGSINSVRLCEPLLEIFACHASATGRKVEDVAVLSIGMSSPLRMGVLNCRKLLFFSKRGLRVNLFSWPVIGRTAPRSILGAAVQGLAERIFIYLLRRAFYEDKSMKVEVMAKLFDPRGGVECVGRPESQALSLVIAEMGRFYGCVSGGLHGMTDATAASFEAGAQKAAGAVVAAFSSGYASIAAGSLALGDICSSVQMVMDGDLTDYLEKMFVRPSRAESETAVAEIAAAVKTGGFLGKSGPGLSDAEKRFFPLTWWCGMDGSGRNRRRKTDVDRARDIVLEFQKKFLPVSHISDAEERELRAIIKRAVKKIKP